MNGGRYKHLIILSAILLLILSNYNPGFSTSSNFSSQLKQNPGNSDKGPSQKIYVYKNLTISNSNVSLMCGNILCFPRVGNFSILFETNVSVKCESIFSLGSNINISNSKDSHSFNFSYDRFVFNGSIYIKNSKIRFCDAIIGGNRSVLRTTFTNDTAVVKNSYLNGTKSISQGKFQSALATNEGQPISSIQNCQLTFIKCQYSSFPISSICESMNYTLSSNETNLSTSFIMGENSYGFNVTLMNNTSSSKVILNLTDPLYLKGFNSQYLNVSFLFPYGTPLTIWNFSLRFNSNSSLNFTGLSHNYARFIDSHIVTLNSTINGNSDPYFVSGFYSGNKVGAILSDSCLLMIDSNFSQARGIKNLPVYLEHNSSFAFVPVLSIEYSFLGNDYVLPYSGILGNLSFYKNEKLSNSSQTSKNMFKNIASYLIPSLYSTNTTETENTFQYSIYNYSGYFSINEFTMLDLKGYNLRKNFSNVGRTVLKISNPYEINNSLFFNISLNYTEMEGHTIYSSINLFYNDLQTKYTLNYTPTRNDGTFAVNESVKTAIGFNKKNMELSGNISYFNGLKDCEKKVNYTFQANSYVYAFHIESDGLPINSVFRVQTNNSTYSSKNGSIYFNAAVNTFAIIVCNSGYYRPVNRTVTLNPGLTCVNFVKLTGNLLFENSNNASLSISINNKTYDLNSSICITLQYGNYTLFVTMNNKTEDLNITLQENKLTISIFSIPPEVKYNLVTEYFYFAISGVLVGTVYNLARMRYRRICKECLVPVRLGEKHRHK